MAKAATPPAKTSPESKEKTFSIAASETEFFILL
jgi:hypothetical protein